MEELRGDQAIWQFDGATVRIRYHTTWTNNAMLKRLIRAELPLPAVSAVVLRPREKRQRWRLRLQLRERADPYAAVGGTLAGKVQPFELTGPPKTALLAEYWADQANFALEQADPGPVPPDAALGVVPPVPLHIQTAEGTGGFDGAVVRLQWSGSSAPRGKRRHGHREYPLSSLAGVEWVPSDGWEYGHLRLLPREPSAGMPGAPKQDLYCLRCNEGNEGLDTLLLAATITAHLWAAGSGQPTSTDPDSTVIYERIRQLGRLHDDGILTDEEFAAKKAELLDRL